jgi:hypothetical protein
MRSIVERALKARRLVSRASIFAPAFYGVKKFPPIGRSSVGCETSELGLRWACPPHPLRLLGGRRERPRSRRAAKKRDQLASPHIRSQGQETVLYRHKRAFG